MFILYVHNFIYRLIWDQPKIEMHFKSQESRVNIKSQMDCYLLLPEFRCNGIENELEFRHLKNEENEKFIPDEVSMNVKLLT